jgi:HEAT repeats
MKISSPQNKPEDHIRSLIAELGNSDGTRRQQARQELVKFAAPAVPALIAALSDRNDHVRWEAAKALGRIRHPSAADALSGLLEDEDMDIRWAAAESLVRLRQEAVVLVLTRLVSNFKSVWLREGTRYVLRQLNIRGYLDDPAKKVLTALDGPAPEVESPWAAKSALDAIQREN